MEAAALKKKVNLGLISNEVSSSSSSGPHSRTGTDLSRPSSPLKPHATTQSSATAPVARLRAKVTSSASFASPTTRAAINTISNASITNKTSTSNINGRTSTSKTRTASTTPRAVSPTRPPSRVRAGALSPSIQPKARSAVRSILSPLALKTTPGTPDFRHRSLTTTASEVSHVKDSRSRQGSLSLHHAVSFSSLQASSPSGIESPPKVLPEPMATSDNEGGHTLPIRVKSKVSGMTKHLNDTLSPPSHPPARSVFTRTRAPSVSSSASLQSPSPPSSALPAFYPITTASPAANPYRFATSRPSPPPSAHHSSFQQAHDDLHINHNSIVNVDPTTIPLPPNSPPISALSFSSRSSLSQSSVSHAADFTDSNNSAKTRYKGDADHLRSTLDNLVQYSVMSSREDNYSGDSGQDREINGEAHNAERKVRAEAKTNRKIADLEITNRSLLAINASLETTKHRQAQEIRELRRKLRESRLILPPRAYQEVKLSFDYDDMADEYDDNDGDVSVDGGDEAYKRVTAIIDGLLDSGRKALEAKAKDFPEGGVAKVLNADELRNWQDSGRDRGSFDKGVNHGLEKDLDGIDTSKPLSPSHVAVPESDDDFRSEDEVEAMTIPNDSAPSSPGPPPILVTESS